MTYGGEAQQLEVLRVKWSSLEGGALRGAGLVPTVSGTEGQCGRPLARVPARLLPPLAGAASSGTCHLSQCELSGISSVPAALQ